ncbi:MAG: extracellular solute-binding protein [Steroidobacteraceae bacterium]
MGRRAASAARRAGRTALAVLGALLCAAPGTASAGTEVTVLYAGSLVNLMERAVGPAFDRASGDHFRGYAGGSQLLANEIAAHLRRADVFLSAAPGVNARLMGPRHGNRIGAYLQFARSPLVIGYNPHSRFAALWRSRPWYRVLQQPGLRLGRTDPKLDPKGRLTIVLLRRAATYYHEPGLARRVLGAPENPEQGLPEEALVGRLQSGQLDAGFFYSTETAAADIPAVHLPRSIAPQALYTIAILRDAPHPRAAAAFVAFLLGPEGRQLMRAHGLSVGRPALTGDAAALPAVLRPLLSDGARP